MRYHELMTEASSSRVVRVFHGSYEPVLNLEPGPLYGVRDFGFAASYAVVRGGEKKAFVHTLDFRFRRLATATVVDRVAERLGTPLDVHPVEVANRYGNDASVYQEIYNELVRRGYDGITSYDFGFRHDFEELKVWVVFDAQVQATVVHTVEVTRKDFRHTHSPPKDAPTRIS